MQIFATRCYLWGSMILFIYTLLDQASESSMKLLSYSNKRALGFQPEQVVGDILNSKLL